MTRVEWPAPAMVNLDEYPLSIYPPKLVRDLVPHYWKDPVGEITRTRNVAATKVLVKYEALLPPCFGNYKRNREHYEQGNPSGLIYCDLQRLDVAGCLLQLMAQMAPHEADALVAALEDAEAFPQEPLPW